MVSLLISEIETEHTLQGMLANLRKKALEKEKKNAIEVGLLLGNFEWEYGSGDPPWISAVRMQQPLYDGTFPYSLSIGRARVTL